MLTMLRHEPGSPHWQTDVLTFTPQASVKDCNRFFIYIEYLRLVYIFLTQIFMYLRGKQQPVWLTGSDVKL